MESRSLACTTGKLPVECSVTGMPNRKHSKGSMSIPAHEIDTTINSYEGTGVHVANQAIILDGEVACPVAAGGLHSCRNHHCCRGLQIAECRMQMRGIQLIED